MIDRHWRGWVSGAIFLGLGAGGVSSGEARAQGDNGPPALEGPSPGSELLPAIPSPDDPAAGGLRTASTGPLHEAFLKPGSNPTARVRAPKSPPPPVVERPSGDRPTPGAQWVSGYWAWDPARGDFAWVSGAWRVPPRDMIWVNGRWQRDAEGWSRVAGFWSPRQNNPGGRSSPGPVRDDRVSVASTVTVTATADPNTPDWRRNGPPADHPADEPGLAPDPDAFYVPGTYAPAPATAPGGDRLVWKPGFWARSQPGWDWVPARWVRRPDGWDFRDGYWARDPSGGVGQDARRHVVARPRPDDPALPPAIVDSEPSRDGVAVTAPGRDPIADAEDANRLRDPLLNPPVVVVPRVMPVRPPFRRPYGYYATPSGRLYDPYGLTPPFVRRFLDRILP